MFKIIKFSTRSLFRFACWFVCWSVVYSSFALFPSEIHKFPQTTCHHSPCKFTIFLDAKAMFRTNRWMMKKRYYSGARCPRGHLLEISTRKHKDGALSWTCSSCGKEVDVAKKAANSYKRLVCFQCKFDLCLICDAGYKCE